MISRDFFKAFRLKPVPISEKAIPVNEKTDPEDCKQSVRTCILLASWRRVPG